MRLPWLPCHLQFKNCITCMLSLYFHLSEIDKWWARELEVTLATSAAAARHARLAPEAAGADYCIHFNDPQYLRPWRELIRFEGGRDFVWDASDFPAGLHAGLYCSLSSQLFDPQRHRPACFPHVYNEQVEDFPLDAAVKRLSFVGGIYSTARSRMCRSLLVHPHRREMEIDLEGGPWAQMLDRSGLLGKKKYADTMRRSRFVLCPRGRGLGTARLFEAMKARRVPVIICDPYVLPYGVDWGSCAVRVPERHCGRVWEILEEYEPRWETMANAAREAWEKHFSPSALLDTVALQLSGIRPTTPPRAQFARIAMRKIFFLAEERVRRLELRRWQGVAASSTNPSPSAP